MALYSPPDDLEGCVCHRRPFARWCDAPKCKKRARQDNQAWKAERQAEREREREHKRQRQSEQEQVRREHTQQRVERPSQSKTTCSRCQQVVTVQFLDCFCTHIPAWEACAVCGRLKSSWQGCKCS